jgi:thiosulfate/3-mercaptopyruvate sulfurtransferase
MRTLLLALAASVAAFGCGGHGTPETMFVSTAWLATHLKDPNQVILAVGDKADYEAGHIPGSVYVEYREVSPKGDNGLTAELPPIPKLAEVFSLWGVGNGSRIVVYRLKDWFSNSARVLMTLDAMGLGAQASMLDGGQPAWVAEGRAITKDAPSVRPGKLEPCAQSDVVAGLDFVKGNLHQSGVRILDARAPEYYNGTNARPGLKPGHIEGAGNVYFDSLLDASGKLRSAAELKEQFSKAGVQPGDKVVTYCFVGQQASALYWISRYLGYDTRLYDGSWEEWSKDPSNPTAK